MPSITFAGSDYSAGELETALNALVGGIIRYARAVVVPFAYVERDAYQARKAPAALDALAWLAVRDDAGANAKAILAQLKAEADRLAQIAQDKAQAAIAAEAAKHTRGFVAAVRAQTQIDLTALLADTDLTEFLAVKSEEFNGLIRNLSSDVLQRIERETLGAIFEGRSNESIARSIRDIDGIGRKRAKLIARDQASKLNGAMNQFRQEQVGVTHYKWKTIIDGRERPTHHANNNKVFEWAKPPAATGHPGHDINCRCRALAILTDNPDELAAISGAPPDPVPALPGEAGEFVTSNLASLRLVAAVPRTNLDTLTAEDIARRLAASIDLQRKLSGLPSSFTERHAERLVVELFGFLPSAGDLEALAASRMRALFASRRFILLSAAKERLQLIERALRQANIRPTSPTPAPAPAIAPPATTPRPAAPSIATPRQQAAVKTYPKGRYYEREAGPEQPIDAAEKLGETFTRIQGRKTGHEWGLVHDDRGRVLVRISSAKPNFVEFSPGLIPEMYDANYRVTFHHNHPSSSSFSVADVRAFELPGLDKLFAHGHDGSTYALRVANRSNIRTITERAETKASLRLSRAMADGRITDRERIYLKAHVRMLALSELGLLSYQYRLFGATRAMIDKNAAVIAEIVADIVGTW